MRYEADEQEAYERHVVRQIKLAYQFGRGVMVSPRWLEQVLGERKLAEQHYGEMREHAKRSDDAMDALAERIRRA